MRIRREELYKQIWSEAATKLATRYDVSSSCFARVCEGLNVPHPPQGLVCVLALYRATRVQQRQRGRHVIRHE